MMLSVMPSVMYSICGSLPVLTKGRIASDLPRGFAPRAPARPALPVTSARSAMARSPAEANRRPGSRSTQRAMIAFSSAGAAGSTNDRSRAPECSSPAITSCGVAPPKSCRPAIISNRMQPAAKRSLRPSTRPPVTCSGDMYPNVPSTVPGAVCMAVGTSAAVARWSASPKSRTLTDPSAVMKTFSGLRSR